jgi:Acetyltransferase (GNAT) family
MRNCPPKRQNNLVSGQRSRCGAKMFDAMVPGFSSHRGFSVIPVGSDELRDYVFRMRYYVYVDIMQRKQIHADHGRKTIREPMDEKGLLYLGLKDGQVIGTVRHNRLDDPSAAYYRTFYRGAWFGEGRANKIQITTKLMVLPQHQRSRSAVQLIAGYAEYGYRSGIEVDLIDCNEHLVRLFRKLGYFTHTGWSFHKEYGRVLPMFLAVDAIKYLQQIRSPLAVHASRYLQDGQYGGYQLISRFAPKEALEVGRLAGIFARQVSFGASIENGP